MFFQLMMFPTKIVLLYRFHHFEIQSHFIATANANTSVMYHYERIILIWLISYGPVNETRLGVISLISNII